MSCRAFAKSGPVGRRSYMAEGLLTQASIDQLAAMLASKSPKELQELAAAIPQQFQRWAPQPGPQSLAYFSEADELLYGGAAGGGKTDLLLGLATTQHKRSVIFRNQ